MWNSTENAFSRSASFREEDDDEEALRWAALERLPTYSRVRRGIFKNIVGDSKEVDVSELEMTDQKLLLERLVNSVDDDPERFFDRMRKRFDAVDLEFPKIEVRFQNLAVESFVHVGSRALPTIPNFIFNMAEAFLRQLRIYQGRRCKLTILDGCSGIIRPSRLTLLLGPPSSGKTTFLLALAGRLGSHLQMSGKITYNGHGLKEFVPPRTSAYVSQQDWHVAEMTVRETLEFAGRCQGVGFKYDMLVELARREKNAGIKPDEDLDIFMKSLALGGKETSLVVEYIMKILGLDICSDTLVGDEMLKVFCTQVLSKKDQQQYWSVPFSPYRYIPPGKFAEAFRSYQTGKNLHEELSIPFDRRYNHPAALSTSRYGVKRTITYYVIGYDPDITRFLRQFLLYFCLHQMSIALFRVMGSLGRNMIVANTFGSFAMLVVMALGGYIISRDQIPTWWIWGYWVSPLMYAQNAASVNEFLGNSWHKRAGNYTNLSLGEALLKARSYFPESYWYWIGVGALLGYTVLLNLLFTFFLANLNPLGKQQAVFSKEEMQERDNRRKGENVVTELRYYLQNSASLNDVNAETQRAFVEERGGELIYAGPLGPKSCELIKYFEAVEGVPKIRPGYNPAAWMLEVTSTAEENRLGVDFAEIYRRSNLFQLNREPSLCLCSGCH
ncbi:hypothetical protein V6N13_058155 [Hibiscus sabdariffa]